MHKTQFIKGSFVLVAHRAPCSFPAQGSCWTMKAQFPKPNIPVAKVRSWYVHGNLGIATDIWEIWDSEISVQNLIIVYSRFSIAWHNVHGSTNRE